MKWSGSIVMKGNRNYSPGDFTKVTHKDSNMVNINLRVQSVEHQISLSGWFTTVELKEDSKAINVD